MDTGNTIVITRRIQIVVNLSDKELKSEAYKTLYQWRYTCFRAANYIFTHLFLQEQVKELFYLTDETQVKLSDIKKGPDGILTTSKLTTTYQVLSKQFKGKIPMDILGTLNLTLSKHFSNDRAAYLKGEKTLRNYKRDIPIPFKGSNMIKWNETANGKEYTFSLFGIPFRTYFGKDFTDKKVILDKMMMGMVKLCSSSIQLKDNKIFLLAAFRMEKEEHCLDDTVIAEACLSIDYPVMVTIGKSRFTIGNKEEFLHRRLAIQSARQRLQKASAFSRSGKGRKRKMKAVTRCALTEKNYVHNRLHAYSRRLVDICTRHNAATLVLISQQQKEEVAKEDVFLLRNWSYGALKEKIAYKAERAGITVIVE